MFARGEFDGRRQHRPDAAAKRGAAARRLLLRLSRRRRRQGQQLKVAVGRRSRRPDRGHRRAWPPGRAWSRRARASWPTATWCAIVRAGQAARSEPGHDERLRLVDPQPDPVADAVRHAHGRGRDGLSGDEDPAVPGHRPADRHGDRQRCRARRRRRWRPRSRARSRTRWPRCRASSTSTPRCRTAWPRSPSSSVSRSRRRKRWTTCATRWPRVRSDLPGDLRDPVITKVNLAGAPILTYTVASTRMDDEALCWFVDNDSDQGDAGVRGVGAVSRVGGVTREVRVELDPARLLALNATAADISRQLRQVQQEALGRARRRRRRRAVGAHDRHRAVGRGTGAHGGGAGRRPPHAPGPGGHASPTRVAEQRSAALLNGKPVVGFEITRAPRRRRGRRRRRRARRSAGGAAGRAPGRDRHRGLQLRRSGAGELRRLDDPAVRGRGPGGAGGLAVPARLARDFRLGGRAAAVGDPGLRGHALDAASRSTSSRCCRCRWWSASWSTMRSSRSRTSCVTCAWARRRTRPRWRRPTRSAWRSSPPPSR